MEGVPPGAEQGRLAWRCRRGMKELDLVLAGYLRDHWPAAPAPERAVFARILELPDPLLAAYLMEREIPADPDLQRVLAILRGCAAVRLPEASGPMPASLPLQP